MSGGVPLRGLEPRHHSSEETSQQWRAVGDNVSDLTDPGIEAQTSRAECNVSTTELTRPAVIIDKRWALTYVASLSLKFQAKLMTTYKTALVIRI